MEENKNAIMQAWEYKPYGYINTVVSEIYKDVPTDFPFPQPYIPDLYKYAANEYFLSSRQNSVYTYFSTVKNDGAPVGIFSKCARKTNAIAVCRYTQAVGWAWSEGELYRDAFDSILNFGFYSETETDALAAGEAAPPFGQGGGSADTGTALSIHPSALRALVYAAFLRWQRSDPLVRIGVPAAYTGEAYNAYVLTAVRQLYSYFPVGLRVKAGFSSYLPLGKEKNMPYLYFGFVPEDEADNNTVFLDGSSLAVYEKLPKATSWKSLNYLIDTLLKTEDPAARQALIGKLFTDVDGGGKIRGLTPANYNYIADTLMLLNHSESAMEMLPTWLRFCKDPSQYPSSLVPELYEKVRQDLTAPVFQAYLEREFQENMELSAFAEGCGKLLPLITVSQTTRDCFWDRAEAIFNAKEKPAEVLAFLREREKTLKEISAQRYQACVDSGKKRLADQAAKRALAAINGYTGSCKQIRGNNARVLAGTQAQLSASLSQEEAAAVLAAVQAGGTERIIAAVRESFRNVCQLPAGKADELQTVVQEAEALLAELAGEAGEAAEAARQEIGAFLTEKRQALGDRAVVRERIFAGIQEQQDYFDALGYVSGVLKENGCFEPEDQSCFVKQARQLRPAGEALYREAYTQRFGKPLTMEALGSLEPLVGMWVLEDLREFLGRPFKISSRGAGARSLYDAVVSRQMMAQQFLGHKRITLELDGEAVDPELLKEVLALEDGYGSAREEAETLMSRLIGQGVFCGEALPRVCELYAGNGWKVRQLLSQIFSGSFREADEETYLRGFEIMNRALETQGRAKPLEDMQSVLDSQEPVDPAAKRAFTSFRKEKLKADPNKKRVHPAVISTIALGVVTVGLVSGVVVMTLQAKKQNVFIADLKNAYTKQTETVTLLEGGLRTRDADIQFRDAALQALEDELAKPEGLSFAYTDVLRYAAAVEQIAQLPADGQTYQIYNDRYCSRNKDYVVAEVNGTKITWGEYFFWECYFASQEQQPVCADTFHEQSIRTQVNSALLLTHGRVCVPGQKASAFTQATSGAVEKQAPAAQSLADDILELIDRVCGQRDLEYQVDEYAPGVPQETLPPETLPLEILPEETLPEETLPLETLPQETVSQETLPVDYQGPSDPVG